jgi:hypothetical protein
MCLPTMPSVLCTCCTCHARTNGLRGQATGGLRSSGNVPSVEGADATWVSLGLVVVIGLFHLAAPALRRQHRVSQATLGSLAGGTAVAYVFLHLLPELARGSDIVSERLSGFLALEGELEVALFLVCLLGFTGFYALERLAERGARAGPMHVGIYGLHLGAFALHNALITFTLRARVESGVVFASLFVIAMGLHFLLIDRALAEHHPQRFNGRARVLLLAALAVGWAVSLPVPADTELPAYVATALLAGSVLWHACRDEIPTGKQAHVGAFAFGVVAYGALLASATALGA